MGADEALACFPKPMKTTLKRGIGRAASVDGNGNGNGNGDGFGVLAPAPGFSRYRQPPAPSRRKLALVGKAFLWFLLAVAVGLGSLLGGAYLYAGNFVAATAPHTAALKRAAKRLNYVAPGKPTVAMVIGYDHRSNQKGLPSRSDTIMLLRTDPTTNTVSMLSLPRDLSVTIKCPGRPSYVTKINAAYAECGPTGTLETVRSITGLPINYLISVNFVGFIQVVDRLGGVYMDVDRRYLNTHTGPTGYAAINLYPGYQKLSGRKALDFVRYRHTDSDLFRVARQQMFVRAVKDRMSTFSLLAIPKLASAIRNNVEIARAGGGGPTLGTLKNYALFLYHLPPGHFFQARIEGLTGLTDLTTAQFNITTAVQDFLNPNVNAPAQASAAAGVKIRVKKKRVAHIRPQTVSIVVLNGNGVPGSAATAGVALAQRHYRITTPPNGLLANDPTGFNRSRSKVYFAPQQPRSRAAAPQVAKLIGNASVAEMPLNVQPLSSGAMLVVVVGQSFHGTLAAAPVVQVPTHTPPYVSPNPGAMLPYLRKVRHRQPFRLENPTLIERASSPDLELPLNAYSIGKYKAVRLTFRLGSNEYWGIEETNWKDAPVLKEKNFEQTYKGRKFAYYYTGSRLHMVVLRANGATYWVVNTLRDSLSNETMIAIARGLRPL